MTPADLAVRSTATRPRPPHRGGRSRLVVAAAVIVVVLGIGVALRILGPGSDGLEPAGPEGVAEAVRPTEDGGIDDDVARRLAVEGRPLPIAELAASLDAAVAELAAAPGIEVQWTAVGTDAGPVEGRALVAPGNGNLSTDETTDLGPNGQLLEQRRVVDGTLHVRALVEGSDGAEPPWDTMSVDALPELDSDRVLVAGARVASSLEHLVVIATAVASQAPEPGVRAELVGDRRRLVVPVAVLLEASGEHVEHHDDGGDVDDRVAVFEFEVGDDGALRSVTAYGWLAQDAELVGPALVEISYVSIPEPVVEVPAVSAQ